MVIWRGWGFLVLFFIIFGLAFGWQWYPGLFKAASGHEYALSAEQTIGWGIGWTLVGALLFLFDRFLLLRLERVPSSGEQMQARIEAKQAAEARGETFVVPQATKTYSSFFFVPLRWLPFVFAGIGVLLIGVSIGPAIEQRAEWDLNQLEIERLEQEIADLEG